MRLTNTKYLDGRLQKLLDIILEDCNHHNLPFEVFETGRTIERQKLLKERGVSKTLKSKHLIKIENQIIIEKSYAVDLVLRYEHEGKIVWSWANIGDKAQMSRDMAFYKMLSYMVTTRYEEVKKELMINKITSGGQWKSFKDWPHYEIN